MIQPEAPASATAGTSASATPDSPPAADRPGARIDLRVWGGRLVLAVLPLVLVLGTYYRPLFHEGLGDLPHGADQDLYIYQLGRMAEVGVRWWKVGDDPLAGAPYTTVVGRCPELYQGVDFLLISSVTAPLLGPRLNYHVLVIVTMLVNGWVAGWIVRRVTGSYAWAALGVVLITLNMTTNMHISGHMPLLRYGWALLVVWAFYRYLEEPSLKRGVWLGLAAVLLIQASFYLWWLLMLGLGVWWLGCLIAGRLKRPHFVGLAGAAAVGAVVGGVLLTPVYLKSRELRPDRPGAEDFFHRNTEDYWAYSSDLLSYVVSPSWEDAKARLIRPGTPNADVEVVEGWNYPGLVVLVALAAFVVARLRGWRWATANQRFLGLVLGLSVVFMLLSLTGGPSVLAFTLLPFFRCYGRAGILVVVLWSVATPVILWGLVRAWSWRPAALLVLLSALAVGLYEGNKHRHLLFKERIKGPDPAWVTWLAKQPADVRLVVFPYVPGNALGEFYYRLVHNHAILNCCDRDTVEVDLRQVGATTEHMNPAAFRYLASLGYNNVAIEVDYLRANTWVLAIPWLESADVVGDFAIFRIKTDSAAFRDGQDGPPYQEVPVRVATPIAANEITWMNGTGEANGHDPFVVFALPEPRYVYAVRLKFSLASNEGDAPVHFGLFWRNQAVNDFVEAERHLVVDLGRPPLERTFTIPVHDTVTDLRVSPDDKPCVFTLVEMVALAQPPGATQPELAPPLRALFAAGALDSVNNEVIAGWAWESNRPNGPTAVDLYDGDQLLGTVLADQLRRDLLEAKIGNGKHSFLFKIPDRLRDGKVHTIRAKVAGTDKDLDESPKTVTLERAP